MLKGLIFTIKLLVVEFYKINAGLLFFLFLLCFAIIPPQYLITTHYALILAQISSPWLTALVFCLWLLYTIRGANFVRRALLRNWETVSSTYSVMGSLKLRIYMTLSCLLILLPMILYAAIVSAVAIHTDSFAYGGYILLSQLLLAGGFLLSVFQLFPTPREHAVPGRRGLEWSPKAIVHTLLLTFYWREKKGQIVLLKIISYISFHIFILKNADFFRFDYFSIFLLLIGFFHSLLIFQGHKHLETQAQFLRNLPIPIVARGVAILLTGMLIYFPELCFLIGMEHDTITFADRILFYSLLVTQFVLLFSLLLSEKFTVAKFVKYAFITFFGYQLLVALFPVEIIILINLSFATFIFSDSYQKYEHQRSMMEDG